MVLSIIICTYNRCKFLEKCINSIINQINEQNDIEIIIVDNNSNDGTKKLIENYNINFINYHLETNQGLSFARNKGIKESKGKYLAFVDDDATINKNWLESLLKHINKKSHNHIYGGPIYPNFEIDCPEWIDKEYFKRIFKKTDGYLNNLVAQDGFSGGNMCIPKSVFEKIGFFNTNLGMIGNELGLGEESELFFRIYNKLDNIKLYNINEMSINHFEAKFKLEKQYLKKRIKLSSTQFTNRLLKKNNFKSYIFIYGKLIKQVLNLLLNFILSIIKMKKKFHYLKNYWIILGIRKSIF